MSLKIPVDWNKEFKPPQHSRNLKRRTLIGFRTKKASRLPHIAFFVLPVCVYPQRTRVLC